VKPVSSVGWAKRSVPTTTKPVGTARKERAFAHPTAGANDSNFEIAPQSKEKPAAHFKWAPMGTSPVISPEDVVRHDRDALRICILAREGCPA
jgi:hypothetical protein